MGVYVFEEKIKRGKHRVDSPRAESHSMAPSPSTIAAVAAMFASTQFEAATVTVRHGLRAGSPVRGSMM